MRRPPVDALRPGAALAKADLSQRGLTGIALAGADLRGADLSSSNLQAADLRDARLEGADLRRADLRGADLSGARLDRADLRMAWIEDANFSGASLRGARLIGTAVGRADFTDADLTDAWLSISGAQALGLPLPDASRPSFERLVTLSTPPVPGPRPVARAESPEPASTAARLLGPAARRVAHPGSKRPSSGDPVIRFEPMAVPDVGAPSPPVPAPVDFIVQTASHTPLEPRPAPLLPPATQVEAPALGRYRLRGLGRSWRIEFRDGGGWIDAYAANEHTRWHRVRYQRGLMWHDCGRWRLESPAWQGWTMAAEGARHRLGKALGRREPQLGDPAFDDAVWVGGVDEATLIASLDPDIRQVLTALVGQGATLSAGRMSAASLRGWPLHALLPALCLLADGLAALPPLREGLAERIHHDPVPGVRARALKHWLMTIGEPIEAGPAVYEDALILLLEEPRHWPMAVADLARVGTEKAIAPLTRLASGWLAGEEKKAARAAIESITRRQGGLRAGGLSVAVTDHGGLSLDSP